MKKIKLCALLIISLHQNFVLVTQESQVQDTMQENIDQSLVKFAHLDDSFQFLQSQGIVHQTFQDFVLEHLAQECLNNEERYDTFDEIIEKAHLLVSDSFKNGFFSAMNFIIDSNEDLNQIEDPIFIYVMSHKDGFMKPMMREWVAEWEETLDEGGLPLLNWCLNHVEIAKMLIDLKADINMQDQAGWAPLHYAAFENRLKNAQMYLDDGADINIQDDMKLTPLHLAAWQNHTDMVQMLIDKGADLNLQDSQGDTPLYKTEYRGVINILIAAGAHLNNRDRAAAFKTGFNYRQFLYHAIRAPENNETGLHSTDFKIENGYLSSSLKTTDFSNHDNNRNNQRDTKNKIALKFKIGQLFSRNASRCVIS